MFYGRATWLVGADDDEWTYLIRVDRDGDFCGWKAGKLSAVLDALADQDYARAIGEDEDTLAVFVLTNVGAVPVKIQQVAHSSIGKVECTLSWRRPGLRGKAGQASVTGFTNIIDI